MNEEEYIKRIKKARASRDICFTWYPESFYHTRIEHLELMLEKTKAARDAAIKERDEALIFIGRQAIKNQ